MTIRDIIKVKKKRRKEKLVVRTMIKVKKKLIVRVVNVWLSMN